MVRAVMVILVIAAVGCGDGVDRGIADDFGCNDPALADTCRCGGECSHGFGGDGGAGGAGGIGGEGGAGGVAPSTEEVWFSLGVWDCYFWDPACDAWPPDGISLVPNIDYTRLEAWWWVILGERSRPDTEPRLPDHVEVCTKKEHVSDGTTRELAKVVDACFDAEYEVIRDGQALSIIVGSFPYDAEPWYYSEVRLYYNL
jgi:hypothetical protein